MTDILADMEEVYLGSRLKRLGERMQAGAAAIIARAGLPLQPSHMPLLSSLDIKAMTIGELADAVGSSQPGITRAIGQLVSLGMVETQPGKDLRQRTASLTEKGKAAMAIAKTVIFPQVREALRDLSVSANSQFLRQIDLLEKELALRPLQDRVADVPAASLKIIEYHDELERYFYEINHEWITSMFELEEGDRRVIENPKTAVIDSGGVILFVEAEGIGIIGTCALMRSENNGVELAKMGVKSQHRGLNAGAFLLKAAIERAKVMGADPFYLVSNAKCAAAIHLYEKHGFVHDAELLAAHMGDYQRCDVAMRYVG
jgi:DNA-binding MarR family transcriptional regulator/GNAT superfamily N-acetyltransferase